MRFPDMKYLRGGYIEKNLHGIISVEVVEGNAALASGSASVSNTQTHSQTNVLLTLKSPSGTLGVHYRYTVNPGTGITIDSIDSSGSVETGDASTISYVILN